MVLVLPGEKFLMKKIKKIIGNKINAEAKNILLKEFLSNVVVLVLFVNFDFFNHFLGRRKYNSGTVTRSTKLAFTLQVQVHRYLYTYP